MRKLLFSLLLLPCLCVAFDRPLPPNAIQGNMQAYTAQAIKIDGKVYRGGAGLRVYNTNGQIILPQSVPQESAVLYQLEANGFMWKIWLLTKAEAEAVKLRKKALKEAATTQ
ncbi:hypothetical protein IGB42_01698 [Andreprevotia sp. IGB-42]|uniref:hypothetical protein n=1 Tax=Andreprevotia sp. IGB-42 TaxID=2497473 RepID=UPI00135B1B48|nr:hypothetical protein [Andreprevotia sp. IGB-42]KAF0814018.1 hypothetical protein IGB42_01698 [Andreprevotia sp. IGB-42]